MKSEKKDKKKTRVLHVMGLGRLMMCLKWKLRCQKQGRSSAGGGYINIDAHSAYDKVKKSESTRLEMKSQIAQKLIADTLKIADSPFTRTYAF